MYTFTMFKSIKYVVLYDLLAIKAQNLPVTKKRRISKLRFQNIGHAPKCRFRGKSSLYFFKTKRARDRKIVAIRELKINVFNHPQFKRIICAEPAFRCMTYIPTAVCSNLQITPLRTQNRNWALFANKSYKTTYFMDLNAVKLYMFGKFNYWCTVNCNVIVFSSRFAIYKNVVQVPNYAQHS